MLVAPTFAIIGRKEIKILLFTGHCLKKPEAVDPGFVNLKKMKLQVPHDKEERPPAKRSTADHVVEAQPSLLQGVFAW